MNKNVTFLIAALALSACNSGPAQPPLSEAPLAGAAIGAPFTLTDQDGRKRSYDEFKGRLVENFAMQELRFYLDSELYYWTGGNQAEVDFIIQNGDELLPLEVKSGTSVKSKSLRFYREKYHPRCGLRLSILNLHNKEALLNIALYLIHKMPAFLAQPETH